MTKTYLVGGAVRDLKLGNKPKDMDYVVVGATTQEMLNKGFSKVGADFPVFLHPQTGNEYALARKERKTGAGYLGFETDFGPDVTLEDDLSRRDLTVNAMAMDSETGELFDPFNGLDDLKNKVLRHTSDAFSEDPVRVLRLARFRARYGADWTVAKETVSKVTYMAKKGVLSELNSERVWKEMSRALMENHPRLFFDTLLECNALHVVFPEVYKLLTALENRFWHPEGNAYEHTMLVLTQAKLHFNDLTTQYCALTHDFGKGLTPFEKLPSHHGHDVKGVGVVDSFSKKNAVPSKLRHVAMYVTRFHMNMHKLGELNPKTFVKMFDSAKGVGASQPEKVDALYKLGVCDSRGRLGADLLESVEDTKARLEPFMSKFYAYKGVKFNDVFPDGESNVNKIKNGLFHAQVQAVKMA